MSNRRQLPPEVVAHEAIIIDSDVEDVDDTEVDDSTEPLLPSGTRATLPNPFVSGLSSRASSFTASSVAGVNARNGLIPPRRDWSNSATAAAETELSGFQLGTVFISLYLGVFLAALDGTVVATLLAHIASEFEGFRNVSWIATAYLIANAAFQPLYGKLTDIFGRKPGLLFSNITFGLGCLWCGLAKSFWSLVAARVVAGIGGGGLTALSTITLSDLVPLRRRGVFQGFGNIMFGSGAALGGVFGGFITTRFGWRWAFLMQMPLILISTFAIQFGLRLPNKHVLDNISDSESDYDEDEDAVIVGEETEHEREKRLLRRVDFAGAFTLVIALVLFLFAVSIGGNQVSWSHPLVVVSLPLSIIVLLLWAYIELYVAAEPIIPVQLLKDRTIFGAAFCNWFMTMSVYSMLFFLPLYFVSVRNSTETVAGTSLIANFVGVAVGSFGSGIYMRAKGRYYTIAMISAVLYIIGTGMVSTVAVDTPMFVIIAYTFLPGVAYGSLLTITLIALIAAVPHEFQAVTTSIQYGFRGTGSTLGVAISTSIYQNVLSRSLHARVFGSDAESIIEKLLGSVEEVNSLPAYLIPIVRLAYLDASRAVFLTCFGLGILTAGMAAIMREHVLHNTIARR
ncbi:major facilitator superfamily domain-containing protein [Lipomyces oligophaga]|uniref:major facilitator superfamily domain-containing protein n=1 Tax=Lipomyces oligophaga TaxID=45792 RepID=UPI0034CE0242